MTTTRGPSEWANPQISESKDTSPKGINEQISSVRTTKKSHQPTRSNKENVMERSENLAAEHAVKQEDDSFYTPDQKAGHTDSFDTLERGVIYFFYRPRVDNQVASGLEDVARSFIVLGPTPREMLPSHHGGSPTSGTAFRVLVVPKKVLPSSSRMKEMAFVEKVGVDLKELQETLFTERHYETQTRGPRTMPEARIYAKGVYSITSTQHGSYLTYILTDPRNIGSVQEDFGIQKQGKWLVQSKNPNVVSPPSVSLPQNPMYPKSFGKIFGDHRWVPLQPILIDYLNAQLLLIGQPIQKNATVRPGLKHEDMDTPDKQVEKLTDWLDEAEKDCRGVDSIYGHLCLEIHHYPKISTMWDH